MQVPRRISLSCTILSCFPGEVGNEVDVDVDGDVGFEIGVGNGVGTVQVAVSAQPQHQ